VDQERLPGHSIARNVELAAGEPRKSSMASNLIKIDTAQDQKTSIAPNLRWKETVC
jgi:hypothetical protein